MTCVVDNVLIYREKLNFDYLKLGGKCQIITRGFHIGITLTSAA